MFEALTIQGNTMDVYMRHNLYTLLSFRIEDVVGVENFNETTVRRCHNNFFSRANGQTIIYYFTGKSLIRYLIKRTTSLVTVANNVVRITLVVTSRKKQAS